MATVLTVLKDRYTAEVRVERGDWSYKINLIRSQLDQVLDRVQVRWGPLRESARALDDLQLQTYAVIAPRLEARAPKEKNPITITSMSRIKISLSLS